MGAEQLEARWEETFGDLDEVPTKRSPVASPEQSSPKAESDKGLDVTNVSKRVSTQDHKNPKKDDEKLPERSRRTEPQNANTADPQKENIAQKKRLPIHDSLENAAIPSLDFSFGASTSV